MAVGTCHQDLHDADFKPKQQLDKYRNCTPKPGIDFATIQKEPCANFKEILAMPCLR